MAQLAWSEGLRTNLTAAIAQGRVEVLDLTHELDSQSPYWPEGHAPSPFKAPVAATYEKDGYFARSLEMPEHFGTHMDAP
ncbi:MAG TPA: cyclase family protein, partial [Terriglobia bacterium]|nr:cyclase family protein [Terriglobia bacterium]